VNTGVARPFFRGVAECIVASLFPTLIAKADSAR